MQMTTHLTWIATQSHPVDPDIDGDGLNNTVETNTGIFIKNDSEPIHTTLIPMVMDTTTCLPPLQLYATDVFPTDVSAHLDTDGDETLTSLLVIQPLV